MSAAAMEEVTLPFPPLPPGRNVRCTKCGGPNDRGGRTRICTPCLPVSPVAVARERAARRQAECPEGKRWCSACDEFLPPAQFTRTKENTCAACLRARNATNHLMRDFGLTDEEYDALLAAQDGCCAICHNTPKKQRLHVDHSHKTGAIRGLLCLWCNHRLLGGARESVDVLRDAIAYLDAPPAAAVLGERKVPPTRRKGRK